MLLALFSSLHLRCLVLFLVQVANSWENMCIPWESMNLKQLNKYKKVHKNIAKCANPSKIMFMQAKVFCVCVKASLCKAYCCQKHDK
jgi:hypothetical protein